MKKEPSVPKIKTEPTETKVKTEPSEIATSSKNEGISSSSISKLPMRTADMSIIKDEFSNDSSDSENSISSESSVDDKHRCPICLSSYRDQNSGNPDVCEHRFCLECIEEWSKKTNTCPIDRKVFRFIMASVLEKNGNFKQKKIQVEDRSQVEEQNDPNDVTHCQVCGRSDREDRLLLCDGCDDGYHCECLRPAVTEIPWGEWFCANCQAEAQGSSSTRLRRVRRSRSNQAAWHEIEQDEVRDLLREVEPTTSRLRAERSTTFTRPVARTRQMERVRRTVNQTRIQRGGYVIETESGSSDFESGDCESEMTDGSGTSEGEEEPMDGGEGDKKCSCIMCDETCQVNLNSASLMKPKLRKRTIGKKRKTTSRTTTKRGTKRRKTTRKGKGTRRRSTKRNIRSTRRIADRSSAVSTQAKIIQAIRMAREQQMDLARLNSQNPLTLTSIEIESMKTTDSKKSKKEPKFLVRNTAWYNQSSILNEIDETNRDIPLSSMSLLDQQRSQQEQQSDNSKPTTSKQANKPEPNRAGSFLDSLISGQKLLLTDSSKVQVTRDGKLTLAEQTRTTNTSSLTKQPKKHHSTQRSSHRNMIETSPAKDKAENVSSSSIAYDPFNPDDSPDENDTPKEKQPIKFEIKGSALTKENKPGVLTESPLNKKDTNVDESCPNSVTSPEVKVEKIDDKVTAPEATESDVKSEKCDQTNGTTSPKSEPKTSEDKPKSNKHHESNSSSHKDYKKDYKADNGSSSKKKHRSRSPHTDKKDSKTQSKSKSPRRSDKSSSKPSGTSTTSSSRQRSRSSSKSKRISTRKSSRDRTRESRSDRDSKRASGATSSKPRSRSRSHKSSKASKSPPATSSSSTSRSTHPRGDKDTSTSNRQQAAQQRDNPSRSDRDRKSDRYSSSSKNDLKRHPSPSISNKQTSSKTLKNSSNKEKKYTDYLFDEMVYEEKRQSIDVDKILLPTRLPEASSSKKQAMEDAKKRELLKTTDNSSLDKRLEHIFGVDNKTTTTNGNGLKAEIEKNNEKSKSSLSALEKDMAKISTQGAKSRDQHQSKKPSDEPYDPEKEYQSVDGKLKSSQNGAASSSRTRSQSNGKSKSHAISPEKKSKDKIVLDTQEKIVEAAKSALKPHFISKKISKEDYKVIMKKVVTKSLHQNKTGSMVDKNKITKLIGEYVSKTVHTTGK